MRWLTATCLVLLAVAAGAAEEPTLPPGGRAMLSYGPLSGLESEPAEAHNLWDAGPGAVSEPAAVPADAQQMGRTGP